MFVKVQLHSRRRRAYCVNCRLAPAVGRFNYTTSAASELHISRVRANAFTTRQAWEKQSQIDKLCPPSIWSSDSPLHTVVAAALEVAGKASNVTPHSVMDVRKLFFSRKIHQSRLLALLINICALTLDYIYVSKLYIQVKNFGEV